MMLRLTTYCFVFVLFFNSATLVLLAQEASPKAEAPAGPTPAELNRLAEQLDAPEYADRQAASQRLSELGKAALPALEKAAQGESREAASRAFDLLKKFSESSTDGTRDATKEVLQRLAKSNSEVAARRAKEMLEPKPAETPNAVPGNGGIRFGGIRVAAAAAGVAGGKRISVKNVDGVKEIEVVEGDRKVKINDDPNQGIKVEITEKKDGKEETKKYEAKDADELKKNHPEAHKEYETYAKRNAVAEMRIQIGGGAAVPLPAPALPDDPMAKKQRAEMIERSIQSLDKTIKSLEAQKKRLEDQKAELEKADK